MAHESITVNLTEFDIFGSCQSEAGCAELDKEVVEMDHAGATDQDIVCMIRETAEECKRAGHCVLWVAEGVS